MTRRTDPPAATVRLVRDRDGNACARCGRPDGLTTHHRRARGMGGSQWPGINLPANLLTLCGSGTTGCHGWVESHREAATTAGLLVSKYADPADVPVWTWRGWMRLDNTGAATPALQETET